MKLFKTEVPRELIENFFKTIGLLNLYDEHWIYKHSFTPGVCEKLDDLLFELWPYYLDCKRFYIERPMTFHRYIQVLRQLARCVDMVLESKEYTDKIDKKKHTMYRLRSPELRMMSDEAFILRFDE